MKLILNREKDWQTTNKPVKGELKIITEFLIFQCKTLELTWRNNFRDKIATNIMEGSCIPAGIYDIERIEKSDSFNYPHLWIKNVPEREYIKIHRGNYAEKDTNKDGIGEKADILGCILVGTNYTDLNKDGIIDIVNSTIAMDSLMNTIPKGWKGKIEIF